jgi:hypothetical protein
MTSLNLDLIPKNAVWYSTLYERFGLFGPGQAFLMPGGAFAASISKGESRSNPKAGWVKAKLELMLDFFVRLHTRVLQFRDLLVFCNSLSESWEVSFKGNRGHRGSGFQLQTHQNYTYEKDETNYPQSV